MGFRASWKKIEQTRYVALFRTVTSFCCAWPYACVYAAPLFGECQNECRNDSVICVHQWNSCFRLLQQVSCNGTQCWSVTRIKTEECLSAYRRSNVRGKPQLGIALEQAQQQIPYYSVNKRPADFSLIAQNCNAHVYAVVSYILCLEVEHRFSRWAPNCNFVAHNILCNRGADFLDS